MLPRVFSFLVIFKKAIEFLQHTCSYRFISICITDQQLIQNQFIHNLLQFQMRSDLYYNLYYVK